MVIKKVIFACMNDVFLSPIAETFYRNVTNSELTEVSSRGLVVLFPEPISPKVNLILSSMGEELCKHGNTTPLIADDITEGTCIITMTLSEKIRVMEEFTKENVYTLGEISGLNIDIADPYGKDDSAYMECVELVKKAVIKTVVRIRAINGGKGMIAIGCDHGGYLLKQEIMEHLDAREVAYVDVGCNSEESCDYPIYAKAVAEKVVSGECEKGIIICGTGIGVSITANKFKGIRAALCHDTFSAEATRLHNDANVLTMGARVVGAGLALKIVDTFLDTPFSEEERHIRRISMIEE